MRILLCISFLYIFLILIILHDPTSYRALTFNRAEIKDVCRYICLLDSASLNSMFISTTATTTDEDDDIQLHDNAIKS